MAMTALVPLLTPRGHLLLARVDAAPALSAELAHRLEESVARGPGHLLLQLGAAEVGTSLPPVFGYWRDLGPQDRSGCGEGQTASKVAPGLYRRP